MSNVMTAISAFVVNPLWIIATISLLLTGYVRVKRERRQFATRIESGKYEVIEGWFGGVLLSIVVSLVTVGVGLTISPLLIVSWIVATLLLFLTFTYYALNPTYSLPLALFISWVMERNDVSLTWGERVVEPIVSFADHAVVLLFIMALTLLAESVLVKRLRQHNHSPQLKRTKRGRYISTFQLKQLWIVPTLFVIPGDWVQSMTYWPQFTLGETAYAFILFPVVIGFQRQYTSTYPDVGVAQHIRRLHQLCLLALVGGGIAVWQPNLSLYFIGVLVIARVVMMVVEMRKEQPEYAFAKPTNDGLLIIGILNDTPAEQLGLQIGETIRAVNQVPIRDEKTFYEAIQQNAAHCRLQIIDRNGEIKLTQTVLYERDHFKLGLLFMSDDKV